jgi:ATP-dependent Clp protease ATP-binding subunit ClpC
MTSNVGTRQLKEFGRGVGFAAMADKDDKEVSRSVIQKALNKQFSPEFLNRIDEIITFDQLELDSILQIIGLELRGLYKRIEDLNMHLEITEAAQKYIAEKGYDKQFGARPLRRAIQQYLEDRISEMIVEEEVKAGDTILADLQDDKIVVSKKTEETAPSAT